MEIPSRRLAICLESKYNGEVKGATGICRHVLHYGGGKSLQKPFNLRSTKSVSFTLRLHGNASGNLG